MTDYTKEIRAKFEEWVCLKTQTAPEDFEMLIDTEGNYITSTLKSAWEAYQAAHAEGARVERERIESDYARCNEGSKW